MVVQYPHTILITRHPDYAQDGSGDFQPTGSATTFTGDGRAEPAGSNAVVTGPDGDKEAYSWIVYMPRTEEEFSYGDTVTITFENGSVKTGTLKRQSNGQFNTRLWV